MKRISGLGRESINFMSVSADIMKTNSLVLQFNTSNEPSDFSVCQVFYTPKKKFLLLPASKVCNFKVKELVELVASTVGSTDRNLSVMIKSPSNFSLLLQDDDCPFSFMDALFFLPIDNSVRSEAQRYYLQVTPKSENKQTHAFIPVIDDKAQLLYMAPLLFNTDQYKLKYIIAFLSKLHSCSTDDFTAYNKKGVIIKEFETEKDFIRALLFNTIYISFKPGDVMRKEISKRVMILSEFRDTEFRYYKTLEGFEENVGNVFKKTNFLTKKESEAFMTSSHYIISLHEQIYTDFQNMRIDYMTLIGQWFKKYVPFLKVYHQYVAFYKAFLPKITGALHSKQYASVFKDFTNSEYANGLVFDSVLIIPVQRGPRYQLLLREVLKNTPETHPDFTILSEALELTKDTLKKLEQDVSLVERRQKMVQLENWFSDKVTILQPNRLYINTFFLFIEKQKVTFILFSDEFWVAKVIDDEKLTLDKAYKYSEVDIIKYAKQSVVLRNSLIDQIYFMESPENRNLLISQFRETAACYIQRQRNQIQLHFEIISQDKPLDLADHQMVIQNDSLYIFGGRDARGSPSGTLYIYSSNGAKLLESIEHKQGSSPCPRYMFGFTSIKNGLFVYGGTTNGKDELDDLWFFSFKSSRWGQIQGKGDSPPPGFGLDLKSIDGATLLLSGGKSECGFYKLTLRDKGKEKEKYWEQIQLKRGTEIMSLYGHSLAPIEKVPGSAIIIGGKNSEGQFNDFPIHITNYGETISFIRLDLINPTNRFLHRCVIIGDILYCFGGHSNEESTTFLLQLSLSSWTVPQIDGAKFAAIGSFAIAVDGENIYLHGGVNKDGKVIGSMLKVVTKFSAEENPDAMIFLNKSKLSFEKDNFVTNMIQNPSNIKDE